MKSLFKAVALVMGVVLYHTIQTSRNKRTVNIAYTMGVEDGLNMAKDFDRVKSVDTPR